VFILQKVIKSNQMNLAHGQMILGVHNVKRTVLTYVITKRSGNRCGGRLKVDHVSTGVDAQFRQTPVVSEEKHLCVSLVHQ
jgi:hypothetical protein